MLTGKRRKGFSIRTLVLHVGLHKTGTTSLQKFFLEHWSFYRERDVEYYLSRTRPNNGSEVAYLVLRDGIPPTDGLEDIRASVTDFLQQSKAGTLLIIGEAFSYLRTPEECERIKALFAGQVDKIRVVVVWRDPKDWWRSYLNQMKKDDSHGPRPAGETTYLDPNGWLTDFGKLRTLLVEHFDEVIEIDYTPNIIATFCTRLEFSMPPDAVEYRTNVRANIAAKRIREFPRLVYSRYLSNTIVGRAKRSVFKR